MGQRDNRHPQPRTSPASRSGCPGCGSQSHGRGTLLPCKENCPHWLTVCRKCKKTGHIQAVCRSSSSVTQIEDVPPESGVTFILDDISTLFSMETDHVQSGHADTTFPHMEWVNDRFVTSDDTSSMISIIYPDSENIPPIPHMEWSEGKFVPCSPKKPRRIYLNVKPLTESLHMWALTSNFVGKMFVQALSCAWLTLEPRHVSVTPVFSTPLVSALTPYCQPAISLSVPQRISWQWMASSWWNLETDLTHRISCCT